MDYEQRIVDLKKSVEAARTPAGKNWRGVIYENIIKYIQESGGDDEAFQERLWTDYLAWTAWYFNGEELPLFLTRKQYKMYLEFQRSDENIWFYQRRAGKCQKIDNLVAMADGTHKKLGDIQIGDEVCSLDESTGKMTAGAVTNTWRTGSKECFELHLDANYKPSATADHKFLTQRGWLPVKDITTNDYIAVPTRLEIEPTGTLTADEARLLSVWIAEGNKASPHTFSYTNGNSEIIDVVKTAAIRCGWNHNSLTGEYCYSITRTATNGPSARAWLNTHGLKDCTTFGAFVPDSVKVASDEVVSAFLNMYAGCDGYVDVNRGMVGFCSRSRQLCVDIKSLLLRFGITSQIREHEVEWNGEWKPTYETQVYGGENFKRYAELIGVCGKEDKVNTALELISNRTYGQCKFDKIPTSTWSDSISYSELSTNGADGKSSAAYALMSAKKYETCQREKVELIQQYTAHQGLRDVLMQDIAWMKVKSIESIGVHETADIEVDEFHNFVCDNVITHNSVGSAVLVLYYAMGNKAKNVLIFAPTEDQLVLMHSVRELLGQDSATYLFDTYIGKDVVKSNASAATDGTNRVGAVFNQKYIRFKNDSDIKAVTLNVRGGGSTRRGFSANLIVVDEFQDVPPEVREEIIEPIIMDAFSDDKKLIYIGTPHRQVDPKLDFLWQDAQASDVIGTLHSHCWEAVAEGIRTPAKMMSRFSKLNIPCKWVVEHGVCPVYLPNFWKHVTGEEVPVDDDGMGVVACGKVCMDNETFVQEDMAMFAKDESIGINPEWVRAAGRSYDWVSHADAYKHYGSNLVMSIDYGDVKADTQICIWVKEKHDNGLFVTERLRLLYEQVVLDPRKVGVANESPDVIKSLYHVFKPKRIFVDATGKKEQMTMLITGANSIPKSAFYTNEASQKNGAVGVWFSGPLKAKMFNNMKEQFRLNRIIVPNEASDMVFWNKFYDEVTALRPMEPTMSRSYVYWGITMHLTDAIALAAMYLEDDLIQPAATEAYFIDMSDFTRL